MIKKLSKIFDEVFSSPDTEQVVSSRNATPRSRGRDPLSDPLSNEVDLLFPGWTGFTRWEGDTETVPIQLETRGVTPQIPPSSSTKNRSVPKFLRPSSKFDAQENFWADSQIFKDSVAAKLRKGLHISEAETLEKCHTIVTNQVCDMCKKVKRFWNRCDNFFCPLCSARIARERNDSIKWWCAEVKQPKHVVLTVQNFPTLDFDRVKWIKNCFTKLRRRVFSENWKGGFWSLEVTNEGRGFHLHIHALVDSEWIDGRELAVEWSAVTSGQGYIVKVKDARNQEYLNEVSKYVVKGSQLASWSSNEIVQFVDSFSGQRTFGVFGSLYKKRTDFKTWLDGIMSAKSLCDCGCATFKYYSDDELESLAIVLDMQSGHFPNRQQGVTQPPMTNPQSHFQFAGPVPHPSNYMSGA